MKKEKSRYEIFKRKWFIKGMFVYLILTILLVFNEYYQPKGILLDFCTILLFYLMLTILGIISSFNSKDADEVEENLKSGIFFVALNTFVIPFKTIFDEAVKIKIQTLQVNRNVRKVTFGEGVRYWREKKGYTQKEFGDILGFSQQNIAKWESEKGSSCCDMVSRVAEVLEISESDLFHIPC